MKIHQIPLGTRFTYQGKTYVKSGPMVATSEGGGVTLIPKYAMLTLDDPQAAAAANTGSIDNSKVLAAFEAFYATCQSLLPAEQQAALATAREQFLKAL